MLPFLALAFFPFRLVSFPFFSFPNLFFSFRRELLEGGRGWGGSAPDAAFFFLLLERQYSTNNRPDLSDAGTNSTYLLDEEIWTNLF